eukprot:TRINITY_DN68005_c0_g1_i1.p1 TRINITY_DN68005_c0_g1~~TRINITY_DN68005_c0_g1_i1.p1  ORF type:complete len:422 (+),score=106.99 TRINITY_DN68005_c0_g1_i1:84-1349(+)
MKICRMDLSGGLAYRGEGNANLVVSLTGSRTILRFPKSKFIDKSQHEKLETIARYVNEVIRPELLEYVDPVSLTTLDWHQLEAIRSLVHPYRPQNRLAKDIFYPAALVLPDYSFMAEPGLGPVMAVEIKPKLGFLFPANMVHPTLCNYCLKQYYKRHIGLVTSPSQYCPLDLYSGEQGRMVQALEALLESPQNNLRIFKDGELLHTEETVHNSVCDQFLHSMLGNDNLLPEVLVQALTVSPSSTTPAAVSVSHCSPAVSSQPIKSVRQCNKTGHQLPQNCILSSVLGLQKRNILPDCEAQVVLNSLLSDGCDLASLQSLVTRGGACMDNVQLTRSQLEKIKMLKDYLLSVTAKDLSIILTMVEDSPQTGAKTGQWMRLNGKLIRFKWSIVDLDPKNLHRISKYVDQKQMWLQAFEESKTVP